MERDPTQTLLSTGLGMQTFSHSNTDHDVLKMSYLNTLIMLLNYIA
jgi:hypothetical protein